MINKLTPQLVASYLPFNLEIESVVNKKKARLTGVHEFGVYAQYYSDTGFLWNNKEVRLLYEEIKLILRPIHSIFDWIEHDNKKVIPAIEAARFVDNGHNHSDSKVKKFSSSYMVTTDKCDDVQSVNFYLSEGIISAIKRDGENVYIATYERIKEVFLKYHIDIFNLL